MYAYGEWHPAGLAEVSGPLQFRVRLPITMQPAPWAVFAIHTTDPDNPWKIDGAPVTESFSPHEWVYTSPERNTVPFPDGDWAAWCQVIYPEPPEPPPGGGEGIVAPGGPELAAAASVSLTSWNPPPYGWPGGFPCQDNGHNDIYVGPTTVHVRNLSVDILTVWGMASYNLFSTHRDIAARDVSLTATLLDGHELAEDPAAVAVHFSLVGLGPCSAARYDATQTAPGAPGTVTRAIPGVIPGLYYMDASVAEPLTGDFGRYLSDNVAVTEVTPLFLDVTGRRRGALQVWVTTTDAKGECPLTGSCYVWSDPRSDLPLVLTAGSTPAHSAARTVEQVEERAYSYGGDYCLGVSYKEGRPSLHNSQERWAVPGGGDLRIPPGEFFADDAWDIAAGCLEAATYLDNLTAQIAHGFLHPTGAPFAAGFYSPRWPHEGPIIGAGREEFRAALAEDEVLYLGGHGYGEHVEVSREAQHVDVSASEIAAWFPPGSLQQARFIHFACCYSYNHADNQGPCGAVKAAGAQAVCGYVGDCSGASVFWEETLWQYLVWGYPAAQSTVDKVKQVLTDAGYDPVAAGWADDPNTSPTVEKCRIEGSAYLVPAITY